MSWECDATSKDGCRQGCPNARMAIREGVCVKDVLPHITGPCYREACMHWAAGQLQVTIAPCRSALLLVIDGIHTVCVSAAVLPLLSDAGCMPLALPGAYQLLYSTALHQMVWKSLTPKSGVRSLQGNIEKIFSDRSELLSKLYVVPGVLATAAPLLDSVVLGPNDPLVPLQQQQQRVQLMHSSLGRGCVRRSQAKGVSRTAAKVYLQLGDPAGAARHESRTVQRLHQVLHLPTADQQEEQQQQQQHGKNEQQQHRGQQQEVQQERNHHQQQQQWCIDADEASALLLAPPVPPECLLGPEVWWAWQQQLMGMDLCDECKRWYRPDQVTGGW